MTQERTTETRLRAIHWTIWYFGVTQLAINTLLVYLILSR
jgi:hypothetical protein